MLKGFLKAKTLKNRGGWGVTIKGSLPLSYFSHHHPSPLELVALSDYSGQLEARVLSCLLYTCILGQLEARVLSCIPYSLHLYIRIVKGQGLILSTLHLYIRIVKGLGLILSTLHLYIGIVRGQGLILSTLHLYIRIAKGLGLILSKKSGFCIDLAESRKNSFFGHISNIF